MEDLRENDPCCRIKATEMLHEYASALPFYPEIKKSVARMNAQTHIGFLISCKTAKAFREYYCALKNGALVREELAGLPRGYLHSHFADSAVRRILRAGPIMPKNARRLTVWKALTFTAGYLSAVSDAFKHGGLKKVTRRIRAVKSRI
ncbi:MAG TPA: hypothetical protein PK854_05830 [Oscillospiraceae bacterium]|nr:hypothetical protein [Oscillospiraceae bacterium]HPS34764.1 hypothetical protein [Oscillospiraceae bacterium]